MAESEQAETLHLILKKKLCSVIKLLIASDRMEEEKKIPILYISTSSNFWKHFPMKN